MTDIFLSYTEKDREVARRVAALLESLGWTVWWDRRIPAGQTWRNVLDHALSNMRCMLVLWSARSVESEWVYEEASEGRRQGKLFPVLIEAVRPPAGFREIQAADLSGWDGSPDFEGLRLLLADLERLLGPAPTPVAAPRPSAEHAAAPARDATETPALPASRRDGAGEPRAWRLAPSAWALAGALLLLVGGAYLAVRQPTLVPSPATQARPGVAVDPPAQQAAARTSPATIDAPAQVATRDTPVLEKRPPAHEATRASAAKNTRCADWLARVQLGETLSDEAQSAFRKECRQ